MGASRQTTTQDSTSTQTPFAQPQLQRALDQNFDLFNQLQGRTSPDFQTVAPFSPQTQTGLDLSFLRGLTGSPVNAAAQSAVSDIATNGIFGAGGPTPNAAADFLLPTARGDFLDFSNNPAFQRGVESINDSVGSIFERAGRTGSGANQSSVARGVGDFAASIFNQERANQLGAAQSLGNIFQSDINNQISSAQGRLNASQLAPGLAATDFQDLQAILSSGGAIDQQSQRLINDQIARFNQPFDNAIQAQGLLNAGVGGLGPLLGGTNVSNSTTEQVTSPGLLNSILGGALTAGSLFGGGGAFPFGGNAGSTTGGGGFNNAAFLSPVPQVAPTPNFSGFTNSLLGGVPQVSLFPGGQ